MAARNVLRVNTAEETEAYRSAVSEIIRKILMQPDETLVSIAETIAVSVGTVSNAFNKKGDLNALYLKRLGQAYGPHTLDPFYALSGGRSVPLEPQDVDPLPSLLRAGTAIAAMRDPASPGGAVETPSEQSAVLPVLEEAQGELSAIIISIKSRLAA